MSREFWAGLKIEMTPEPPMPDAAQLANAGAMNVAAGFMKPEDRLKSYDALLSAEFAR